MNTQSIILNRNFQKLAAPNSLLLSGPLSMKPAVSTSASEMLSKRLQAPEVPPAKRGLPNSTVSAANKALNTALSAYKTKGKYTDRAGNPMPGKYKGLSFKGTF